MKFALSFVLLLGTLACVLCRTPPKISYNFYSNVMVEVDDSKGRHQGYGIWAMNYGNGSSVESYKYEESGYDVFNLQRYDLGEQFWLDPTNTSRCRETKVSGDMPDVWDWLNITTFVGSNVFGSQMVDVWEAHVGYATMRIAVVSNDTTVPVYIFRSSRATRNTTYLFNDWVADIPPAKFFDVPSVCNATQPTIAPMPSCVDRSTMMSRGQVWVDNHVPYNQGGTYGGYREDCSGFVSMCWEAPPPGPDTESFPSMSSPISKGDLQPGDCLLYAAEHVVLFGGWIDAGQTQYTGLEETTPGQGTISGPVPYPYWYSQGDFLPYRYNSVC